MEGLLPRAGDARTPREVKRKPTGLLSPRMLASVVDASWLLLRLLPIRLVAKLVRAHVIICVVEAVSAQLYKKQAARALRWNELTSEPRA